ncbi:DUF1684 domain-containing protein [Psychromicrobium lacuslunae]|uniref:DUF1684 domain-containing protein n=1 Tax=Psychromicrobium lacuslunae TaxID=1618207 RepID=A0A0D4C0S8_9MICC|nr:DUF1684 domain-containing protein [Psychromicrobium lacuslunae]AJT42154.1 hypothetical protein UM93_12745 [Psychromicrobium lacuslunae]
MANSSWQQFRDHRNQSLPSPHGWLSLTSLQWLPNEPGKLDGVPGLWSVSGELAKVSATAQDGLQVLSSEAPLDGELRAELAENESVNWLRFGTVLIELAKRGGSYAIRTRDSAAPTLNGFKGVPTFDYADEFIADGQFVRYPTPQLREIATANPRVPGQAEIVGEISFELAGQSHTLLAQQNGDDLLVNFHDTSNGEQTAGWRFLTVKAPDDAGAVQLDFNYALNWPSGFSAFGTCPRPLAENTLDVPVLAGEKHL